MCCVSFKRTSHSSPCIISFTRSIASSPVGHNAYEDLEVGRLEAGLMARVIPSTPLAEVWDVLNEPSVAALRSL